MARPNSNRETVPIGVRLLARDIERAVAACGTNNPPLASVALADAVRAGTVAVERQKRIGAQGFEIGTFDHGLELLIRVNTAHGARALQRALEIFERELMFVDQSNPQAGFAAEQPTQDWQVALTEIRALVETHGGSDTVIHDSQGRACRIEFFKDESDLS